MTKSRIFLETDQINWEDGASFCGSVTLRSKAKPKQRQATFDAQLKITLNQRLGCKHKTNLKVVFLCCLPSVRYSLFVDIEDSQVTSQVGDAVLHLTKYKT